jgi:hypothetical protein
MSSGEKRVEPRSPFQLFIEGMDDVIDSLNNIQAGELSLLVLFHTVVVLYR